MTLARFSNRPDFSRDTCHYAKLNFFKLTPIFLSHKLKKKKGPILGVPDIVGHYSYDKIF